jgi:hypothetical protein
MQGSNCFPFLGEVIIKPTRTLERLVKEDLRERVCLMVNTSQLGSISL